MVEKKVQVKQQKKDSIYKKKLESNIEEYNSFRQVKQQDLKMIKNLINLAKLNDKLFGGEQQLQIQQTNQQIEQFNKDLGINIKDLKDKEIDFTCGIHYNNVCLFEQLLIGEQIYHPQNCSCKILCCKEIVEANKCPQCLKTGINFVPVIRGDMYIALNFTSLFDDSFYAPENIPNELKIVMARLAYLDNFQNQMSNNLIESIVSKEQIPLLSKFYTLKTQTREYQIPEFINYDSIDKKLTQVIDIYLDSERKVEKILQQ